jgi:hypothetical protein
MKQGAKTIFWSLAQEIISNHLPKVKHILCLAFYSALKQFFIAKYGGL